jgi:hypothetical protein
MSPTRTTIWRWTDRELVTVKALLPPSLTRRTALKLAYIVTGSSTQGPGLFALLLRRGWIVREGRGTYRKAE